MSFPNSLRCTKIETFLNNKKYKSIPSKHIEFAINVSLGKRDTFFEKTANRRLIIQTLFNQSIVLKMLTLFEYRDNGDK